MQTYNVKRSLAALAAAAVIVGYAGTASAFDPARDLGENVSGDQAYAYADQAMQAGQPKDAVAALEFAARKGHARSQWRLARMYADGIGVNRDDLKAFEYFSMLANQHADDSPFLSSTRMVSDSFVELAHYYLSGIPDTSIGKNLSQAFNLLSHAATYFGDPDAQYRLGEMYLEGNGVTRNPELAARWFNLAGKKQHVEALGRLGVLLYAGSDGLRARRTQGLKFLEVAVRQPDAPKHPWIVKAHDEAFAAADQAGRDRAVALADNWMKEYAPR